MNEILQWDVELFQWLNTGWHYPWLDALMPYWRSKYFWFPFYIFVISFFLINLKKQGLFLIISIALTVGTADFVSSSILKKSIKRLRPCKTEVLKEDLTLLINCGAGYSFPSSHAANHFAMAVVLFFTLGKVLKKIRIPLFIWATSIALGQVYVGVHFPLDIIAGAILGTFIGLLGVLFINRI